MTFIEYLRIPQHWERELARYIKKALNDPDFPQISKSFELTRHVLGKIDQSDLRWYQRREILCGTRFVWHCYKYALEDQMAEEANELLV